MILSKKCKVEGCRLYLVRNRFKYYVYGRRAIALADDYKEKVNNTTMALDDFDRLFKNAEKLASKRRQEPEIYLKDLVIASKVLHME